MRAFKGDVARADYSEYEAMASTFTSGGWSGHDLGNTRRSTRQWLEAFETHCRLQAVVNRIATDVSKTKWILLEDDPETGKPREVRDHPLVAFLHDPWKTCVGGSLNDLCWMIQAGLELEGNAYLRPRWGDPQSQDPTEVWPIPVHAVDSVPTVNQPWFGIADHFHQTVDRLRPAEVIWFRRPSLINPFGKGVGIASSLDDEISQDIWAGKFNNAWFRNGARPDLVVQVNEASRLERRRMEEEWNTRYGGFWNSFKTAFVNAETKLHVLTANHKDMEFQAGRKLLRDIIFQTFGVPPEIMGVVENSNRATAEAALYIYSLQCILPRVQSLCANFNRLLVPLFVNPSRPVYLGFENPVRETEEFKLEKAIELFKAGAITRDECRDVTGFDPMGGLRGEELLVPVNMTSIGPADARPAPPKGPEPKEARRNLVTIFAPRGGVMTEFRMERAA